MNIVLLTSSLNSGGAERVAVTLCNAWASRGDKVTLIPTYSGLGSPFYETVDGVEVIYLSSVVGAKRKNVLTYSQRIFALRKLIVDRAPDVIVSFLPNVNIAAILSTAFLSIPLIICERRDPSSQPCARLFEVACKFSYRFADMLTVQTEGVATTIRTVYPRLNKVFSVSNPLPNGVVNTVKKARGERKILLCLGRLSVEKQIDNILDTFSHIAPHFDGWDLHIYGEGPLKSTLDLRIKELGLSERAFLKGLTSEPWDVMSAADAFVMTSKFEGFPNALLEAMGVGLPCIVYNCRSGPYEITRGGADAILVPLNDREALQDAMEKIMGDEPFRVSLGIQARKSVLRRFQLSFVLDRWDELFKEVGVSL